MSCKEKNTGSVDTEVKVEAAKEDTTEKKSEPIVEKITIDSPKTISNVEPKVEKKVRDTIKIDLEKQADYNLKVGQLISCSLYQFGSTGLRTTYSIDNDEVLLLVGNKREFNNPSKSDMQGGDRGYSIVVFEAQKAGTCNLVISEMYRGKLRKELKYRIIVE
jgi:hypothetical protein